ncbi:hypothetical protein THRCLA_06666, partial [Thraustotheca clavata]
METLILSIGRHQELVEHELIAVAALYGETVIVGDIDRFFYVKFLSFDVARCVVARCVLLQACFEVLEEDDSVEKLLNTLEVKYPLYFGKEEFVYEVKAPKKRLKNAKDKRKVLGKLCRLNAKKYAEEKSVDEKELCFLIKENGNVLLGRLIAHGLSPSTGSRGGRIGGGIAAKYALNKRPYTGITTMDPELALVMANLAQIQNGDWVLDPFAGSAGILLACAHFGMGMGFAHDISFRALQGDGPGRDIDANFSTYSFAYPEKALADVRYSMWRPDIKVDAIVCDPPYNIRTFGSSDSNSLDNQLLRALVQTADRHLVPGGRLVCYVCVNHSSNLNEYLQDVTSSTTLKILLNIKQQVTAKDFDNAQWLRSLVVLEKPGVRCPLPIVVVKPNQSVDTILQSRYMEWKVARSYKPLDIWRAAWVGDLPALSAYTGNLDERDANGKTALFFACGYNQIVIVKFLLDHVDVNACDDEGTSPLCQATRFGHLEVMELLLIAGADACKLSQQLWFPAYYAATYNHFEALNVICKYNTKSAYLQGPGLQTILHRAAECGHDVFIEKVLTIVPKLASIRDFHGRMYVTSAARSGYLNVVQNFFSEGIDLQMCLDNHNETPLDEAIRYGRTEVVEWLV